MSSPSLAPTMPRHRAVANIMVNIYRVKAWVNNEGTDLGPAPWEDGSNRHTSLAVLPTKP